MNDKELAQALYQAGLLTQAQIQAAATQRSATRSFAEVVVDNGWITREQLASVTGDAPGGAAGSAPGSAPGTTAGPWGTLPSTPTPAPPPPQPYAAPPPYAPPIPEPSGYIPPPSHVQAPQGVELAQQSGLGTASVLPAELQGFNWGAFLWNWIWGIAHNTWIAMLALVLSFIPVIGGIISLGVCIWLGIKGNELAWQNRKWESIEQFRTVQRIWTRWGVGLIVFSLLCVVLIAVLTVTGSRVSNTFAPALPAPGFPAPGMPPPAPGTPR